MTKQTIILIAVVAMLFIGAFTVVGYGVGVYNRQVTLQELYDAKVNANKADLSNLKSKFSEVASITNEQMDKLSTLFTNYASARTSENAGAVMNWVKEAIPSVDTSVYTNLMNIVSSTRDSWTERQKELVDISRQYNTNLVTVPSNIVLSIFGDFKKIEPIVIVTSSTAEAFRTGVDEPTTLFPKPEKK